MRDQSLDARLEELAHPYRVNAAISYDYDAHAWKAYLGSVQGVDVYEPHKALDRAVAMADRLIAAEEAARRHFVEEVEGETECTK